ncbi:MAG: YitT family protein [Oscillospiraceae bacterium]|nr:YitT family protein [Oscillospiraceae bacterium]MBR3420242.1 YitT family protein [Oscillospiraceae bacterium]
MKTPVSRHLLTTLAVTVAAFIMAVNKNTFIDTAGLYPGGVSGLTILIQRFVSDFFHLSLPFTVVNLLLNAIPVYIGFRYIGKNFTLYSCLMIVLNSIFTDLLPSHIITEDVLLISIFGGIIQGAAIALCLNAGATSGGTDFILIFLSERRGVDSFSMILAFNAVILCIAGFIFGWDKALYSIIFQYASTAVLHVLYKKFQQSTLFIVTTKPVAVCNAIYNISKHGATVLEGEGSYEHCERNVVYSVVSAAESRHVIKVIREADPDAFINEMKTQKLSGRFYQPKEQ